MRGSQVFWAVVGGFLTGVALRSFFPVGTATILYVCVLALTAFALGYVERGKRTALSLIAIALIAIGAGALRMQAAVVTGDSALNARLGEHVTLDGVVSTEPDVRESSVIVTVALRELAMSGTSSVAVSGNARAILPAHSLIAYGDEVTLSGTLALPEAFDTGLGRQFNYPLYLAAQGVSYEVSFARASTHGNSGNPIVAFVYMIKQRFVEGMRAVLPEPEAGLASGITVGDKRSIGPELSAVFQRDSLLHMIVLSGYNITVVLNALARVLQSTPRLVQFSGSIGVVAFFILVAGGAGSATRAGLMALIAVFARATHRTYLGERALAAVAFLMVLWNPFTLAFDPSFQLSALATLGLIMLTPVFAQWFSRVPERFGMREIVASTCATQTMVLPLLLYQNGLVSLVALPANVLALVPVPFAMLFSFVAALGGMLFGTFAAPAGLPAYLLLGYILAVARFFAALPFAAFSLSSFSAWWMVGAYAALFAALGWRQWRAPNENGPAPGGAV